jgi:hypothetical protein
MATPALAPTAGVNIMRYMQNAAARATTAATSFAQAAAAPFSGQPSWFGTPSSSFGAPAATASWGTLGQIAIYLAAILLILFVLSLFVHFFITPVYSFHPGSPGFVLVPGLDDGTLFWDSSRVSPIQNTELPIQNLYFGYTYILDVFIENPMQFSTKPRVIFSRGATPLDTPVGNTLTGMFSEYNVVMALLPDTNDMIVSVMNTGNNMENVIVPNVPVQEPFRVGVVVMEQALEVYLNGYLMQTRKFSAPPKDVKGDVQPVGGKEATMARVRNFKVWPRLLTTAEIREARPPLLPAAKFGAGPIPSSAGGCLA